MTSNDPKVEHPESRVPLRLDDNELVLVGAYVRGDISDPSAHAQAIATVGVKLTKFFIDVAATAVEHYDREVPKRPSVVCLCGSTRFYDEFQEANYSLTMAGEIVLSVGFYPHAKAKSGHGEGVGHDSEEKVALDELHKRKIDLADWVYVINPGGYIGESTASEIHYAYQHGKPVRYLAEIDCNHEDMQCPPGPCDRFYPPVVERGRDG